MKMKLWRKEVRFFEPMEERELLEALGVADDEPLLRAVVHVLHGQSLVMAEQAGTAGLPSEQAKGFAMASVAVEDACDEILRLAEEGRRKRRGQEK